MTKKEKSALTILYDNEKIELKSGFVGGWMADYDNCPMGMYAGNLNVTDTNIALIHLLRAVIKMNTEEQGLSIEQSKAMINFATDEAVRREKANKKEDNHTLEEHREIVIKMRNDNANKGG